MSLSRSKAVAALDQSAEQAPVSNAYGVLTHMKRLTPAEIKRLNKEQQSKPRDLNACNPYMVHMRVSCHETSNTGPDIPSNTSPDFPSIQDAAAVMNCYNQLTSKVVRFEAGYEEIMKLYNLLCTITVPPGHEARFHKSPSGNELCTLLVNVGIAVMCMKGQIKTLQQAILTSFVETGQNPI